MIAKGNLHGAGQKLAAYLVAGHAHERAELVEMRGFAASDLRDAFRDIEIQAQGTDCEKPFFHCYTRLAPGEALDRATWLQVADREEKRLGFTGQPRAVAFHIDRETGAAHMHIAWSRIAPTEQGQLFAIDPGLYKNKLKELCRELEWEHGLRVVSSERKADQKTRAPVRAEFEESRRLDTDLKTIRNVIHDCLERSDNGKAFAAAIGAHGLMLANGDRRDCFVVIDQTGGHHALNKKLTGMTLAVTRERFADIDRSALPTVDQAKELQTQREAAREARQRHDRPSPSNAPGRATSPSGGAGGAKERPLSESVQKIREALKLSDTPQALARALEERGLRLTYATVDEARRSERTRAFAKAVGRNARIHKDGEFAVIDQRGHLYRFTPRTTGADVRVIGSGTEPWMKKHGGAGGLIDQQRESAAHAYDQWKRRKPQLAARLGFEGYVGFVQKQWARDQQPQPGVKQIDLSTVDRSELLSLTAAKEGMRAAAKAAWKTEQQAKREEDRPPSRIESRIAECADQAQRTGALIERDADGNRVTGAKALADRLKPDEQRTHTIGTVHGAEAFAARLEQAGIAIVRVTSADVPALDDLRRDADMARLAAETNREAYRHRHFETLEAGELAAVTRAGDVHRINPAKLGDAKQYLPADLPSMCEARAVFETGRTEMAELWQQRRADNTARAVTDFETRRDGREIHSATRQVQAETRRTIATTERALFKTARAATSLAGSFLNGVAGVIGGILDVLAGPAKPPTREEAQGMERAATEQQQQAADTAAAQENAAAKDQQILEQSRTQQQRDLDNYQRYGGALTDQARLRDKDHDRGRKREQE